MSEKVLLNEILNICFYLLLYLMALFRIVFQSFTLSCFVYNLKLPRDLLCFLLFIFSQKILLYTCFHSSFICNHGHNVLKLFDVLPNFSFTKSETNREY